MREKLSASHLSRRAYVYVRQSTAAQVFEHSESTKRQYALVERAVALGWEREAVEIVDEDLGRSAASTEGRSGFGRLVDAVVGGEAGGILAIEVSRLARSSEDWQRLISLCTVAQVAVIDESTIYDPGAPDDKLLLDLKGTMSEAELTWLGLRLTGARRSKARRGELRLPAPTGYVWGENGYELDPDEAVRGAVRLAFERFALESSAWAVVRWAREGGLLFPTRRGQRDGISEVRWKPLGITRLSDMLHNPVYAGVYVFGRRRERKALLEGQIRRVREASRDPARWPVRIEGAHEGYISWEAFVRNQEKLRQNVRSMGGVTAGAPREGPALLSGLVLCGRCGRRMRTTYRGAGRGSWRYGCPGDSDHGEPVCWSLPGGPKPPGITFEQAATLNVAGLTALQGLRDRARVRAGERVLVNGAGGGVGTFAVQVAKSLGAHVTAVTRAGSVDVVRSIGADEVIDHDAEDFTGRGERWDVIFDIGGNHPFRRCRRVMRPDGILVAIGGPAGRWIAPAGRLLAALMLSPLTRRRRVVPFVAKSDAEGLALLAGLVERGTIAPVIDRRFALSETAEAVRFLGTGHARGKVVIHTR